MRRVFYVLLLGTDRVEFTPLNWSPSRSRFSTVYGPSFNPPFRFPPERLEHRRLRLRASFYRQAGKQAARLRPIGAYLDNRKTRCVSSYENADAPARFQLEEGSPVGQRVGAG